MNPLEPPVRLSLKPPPRPFNNLSSPSIHNHSRAPLKLAQDPGPSPTRPSLFECPLFLPEWGADHEGTVAPPAAISENVDFPPSPAGPPTFPQAITQVSSATPLHRPPDVPGARFPLDPNVPFFRSSRPDGLFTRPQTPGFPKNTHSSCDRSGVLFSRSGAPP